MFQVTYDSANGKGFMAHKPDGMVRCFTRSSQGLFYSVMKQQETVLVNTVETTKSEYSNHD
eukprot:12295328-Ditylum_brightwellii.AAC.1